MKNKSKFRKHQLERKDDYSIRYTVMLKTFSVFGSVHTSSLNDKLPFSVFRVMRFHINDRISKTEKLEKTSITVGQLCGYLTEYVVREYTARLKAHDEYKARSVGKSVTVWNELWEKNNREWKTYISNLSNLQLLIRYFPDSEIRIDNWRDRLFIFNSLKPNKVYSLSEIYYLIANSTLTFKGTNWQDDLRKLMFILEKAIEGEFRI